MINCAYKYYKYIFEYIQEIYLTLENTQYKVGYFSVLIMWIANWLKLQLQIQWFGISYLLLIVVINTILFDTVLGTASSIKKSKRYFKESQKFDKETIEYRANIRKCKSKRFNSSKLLNTFFKIFTLMAYLFFATELTKTQSDLTWINEVFDISVGALIKAPVAILWYHEFKSIGRHIEELVGNKPNFFNIIERLFEPKINKFFKDKNE